MSLDRNQPEVADAGLGSSSVFQECLSGFGWAAPWIHKLKQDAWERFQRLPAPHRKDEQWRFASVQDLALDSFRLPVVAGDSSAGVPSFDAIRNASARMVFHDDALVEAPRLPDTLREQGVIYCPMDEALREYPELVREHLLTRLPGIGSQKYESLHAALFHNGTFLYVPANVEIAEPFITVHWSGLDDGTALFPHTLVVVGDNARATVLDLFQSVDPGTRHFVCGVSDVYAGAGSHVHYETVQNWNLNTVAFHLNSASAERDAALKSITVNLGSAHTRNEQHCRILGAGASVDTDSLTVAKGTQEIDQRTMQTHSAPNGHSDLLFKNALLDDARTIFSGLIRVDEVAQQTDAYQTNRNLLLSDTAEANSLPGLQIAANDVKCSHGATTGSIDDTNIFYFLSRGIPRRMAEELIVFGFFEEIVSRFDNDELSDFVRELVQNKFRN